MNISYSIFPSLKRGLFLLFLAGGLLMSTHALANNLIQDTCTTAPCYSGDGVGSGVGQAGRISGVSSGSIRGIVTSILITVLSYMGLVAVVVIVIAGIYLVVSNGDEAAKEKAKKIILYTIAGLLIILFASALVSIFTEVIPGRT